MGEITPESRQNSHFSFYFCFISELQAVSDSDGEEGEIPSLFSFCFANVSTSEDEDSASDAHGIEDSSGMYSSSSRPSIQHPFRSQLPP
jgi:hypothetical protein